MMTPTMSQPNSIEYSYTQRPDGTVNCVAIALGREYNTVLQFRDNKGNSVELWYEPDYLTRFQEDLDHVIGIYKFSTN